MIIRARGRMFAEFGARETIQSLNFSPEPAFTQIIASMDVFVIVFV